MMGRKKKVVVGLLGVGAIVVAVALALFQPWLLFVDDRVDEADEPGAVVATATGGLTDTAVPTPGAGGSGGPVRIELAAGDFIDAEHGTTGRAIVYRREDGSRYLRLEDLATSNGPDLHVWITDRPSGGDCGGCFDSWGIYDDGAYIELGALKGNQGSQTYEIPAAADLAGMQSVVIWCDRFNVAFGTVDIT